jgi:predicted Fe-Mo cluster-binding NifX family protein
MRVAAPVTKGRIPNHLGHCESFLIADVSGREILREIEVPNPGHGPGGPPPVFLHEQGVEQILAWGAPPHAMGMFARMGIRVQLGVTGEPRAALREWLEGTLTLTDERLDAGGGCGPGE